MDFKEFEHFESYEFDSPDLLGSGSNMNVDFVRKLHKARLIAGVLFFILSGFRTWLRNKLVGGTKNSSHLKGVAADIRTRNSTERYLILSALMEVGFNRIGIGENYIHVDDDPSKTSGVIWHYYPKKTFKQRVMKALGIPIEYNHDK